MQLEPYLHFAGECEAALTFYARVFGGEIVHITRNGDAPPGPHNDPAHAQRIMHATFRAPGVAFMASDGQEMGRGEARRVSLSLGCETEAEGGRVFAALAEGGEIFVPFAKQFWGATFGMVTDRFGLQWMVNAGG